MSLPPSDNGQLDSDTLSNKEILKALVECIRNNDKHTLEIWLDICKNRSFPPQAVHEETPLHVAASKPEYKECLELLLEYTDCLQINIDHTSYLSNDDASSYWSNNKTALQIACKNGCDESVLILLQKQCDVDKSSCYEDSALHIAAEEGHFKITQYLLEYGASINKGTRFGYTPLHKAALSGHLEVARILLEKGANTRLTDNEFEIPLCLACRKSDYNMIRLLVEHDSSTVNYQDWHDVTPLMVASENSPNEQCVRLLHEKGASFSSQDWMGRLALHYAAKNSNVGVLRYVLEHTDASSIEQCFNDIPYLLKTCTPKWMDSLLCCAIDSRNIECLEILLSSDKLSTGILQTPRIKMLDSCWNHYDVYSPLTLLFSEKDSFTRQKFDLYLRFLFKHKLTMLDESFGARKLISPLAGNNLLSPFSELFHKAWRSSKRKYYFRWLNTNGITIDYCLQCYYDNTQLFASFDDYIHYYNPVLRAILKNNVKALILMMSTSAILEPDTLIVQMNMLIAQLNSAGVDKVKYTLEEHRDIYKYLISLKPIFHTHAQLYHPSAENNKWLPCHTPNAGQEFAESTLKQLCRTTIRQHLRKDTLEANLRDFRRNISELPLPPSLKDYLLFKS